jgi:hypothetical protein
LQLTSLRTLDLSKNAIDELPPGLAAIGASRLEIPAPYLGRLNGKRQSFRESGAESAQRIAGRGVRRWRATILPPPPLAPE